MSKLLLSIMLFASICSYSQTKTEIGTTFEDAKCIEIYGSEIRIKGDSITTIKKLLKVISEVIDERDEAMDSVLKSVKWSNTVPDYWKKNKQWHLYLNAIKLQDFKFEKQEQNKTK